METPVHKISGWWIYFLGRDDDFDDFDDFNDDDDCDDHCNSEDDDDESL